MPKLFNPRDITWLAFNERVLQEAQDPTVPLPLRIRFLGIFSNNLDEFFRVRVAGLKRAMDFKEKFLAESFYETPSKILRQINKIVIQHQEEFSRTWAKIREDLAAERIFIKNCKDLTASQAEFVVRYFDEEVESNVIPILLQDSTKMPYLRDKSLYLGIAIKKENGSNADFFSIIEIPSRVLGRFVILPSENGEENVMLLEDVIIYNLPHIFSYFGYKNFSAHAFKVTKDAEFDLDNDINSTLATKIERGIKTRRKGKPTRFAYDRNMDADLLQFLIKKLNLTKKDSIIAGDKIHNFKHFMDFPPVFPESKKTVERTPFLHPKFKNKRVMDVILKEDVLLTFPYHSFSPVIDLLREAAMDPEVQSIFITAYRLAPNSKIINTLINAARNGKEVTVMLELRARFDEEANLFWKERLELEGVTVLVGLPDKKVHAKLCLIKKIHRNKAVSFGFISTGNFNEKTAKIYSDHLLMTSNAKVMKDIDLIFQVLKNPVNNPEKILKKCTEILTCPVLMRDRFLEKIDFEIKEAKNGRKAEIILKINSLSDRAMILKLYEAAEAGVVIKCVVRGIYCAVNQKNFKQKIHSISIIDEYLEHARVIYFYNKGAEDLYISSADFMKRNLDYRLEAAIKITQPNLKQELKNILALQLQDNVKARILDNKLKNKYVENKAVKTRAQIEIYHFLKDKVS